ncbi:ParB-like partition protein [Burkholderiales bacterium 8X]|nr:ParB-like partition protein [Burkholderiales bacterium 8X]
MRNATEIRVIQVSLVDVLNPRSRNADAFNGIIENIRLVGLKKPISVTPRTVDGVPRFTLICGEGRLLAFKALGQREIPARIIDATDEESFVMSLVENIARRKYTPLELLDGVKRLLIAGKSLEDIAAKTGLTYSYVRDINFLLNKGEERLVSAVKSGTLPIKAAIDIVSAGEDSKAIQNSLQQAYDTGQLRGRQLFDARRLIEKRRHMGKSFSAHGGPHNSSDHISANSLVRAFRKEVARQESLVRRAHAVQRDLLFIVGALRTLAGDDNFCTLLRAEGLDTLPKFLADRLLAAIEVRS